MALILLFLLGVGNFAMHKAVLESGHPLLTQMAWLFGPRGRYSLLIEFVLLVGSMAMVGDSSGWLWGYALYTVMQAGSAWAILSGRM